MQLRQTRNTKNKLITDLRWNEGTANEKEIVEHLRTCEAGFVAQLRERINLTDYAKKIRNNAVTFEAWNQQRLVGLVAAYLNDPDRRRICFVTNVSVTSGFEGCGIATRLLGDCHQRAAQIGMLAVRLEVNTGNIAALSLYRKLGYSALNNQDDMIEMERISRGF